MASSAAAGADKPHVERRPLWRALAGALLPNAAFLLAGCYVRMPRGAINLDYLALAVIAPWMPAPVFVVCTTLLLSVDAVESLAGNYYFSFADALSCAADFVHLAPLFACGVAAALLLIIVAIAFASQRLLSRSMTPRRAALLLALTLLLAAVDFAGGTNIYSRTQGTTVRFNVAGSTALRATGQISRYVSELRHPLGAGPVTGATAGLLQAPGSVGGENVVLIVEESFGLMLDERGRELLLSPLRGTDIAARYEFEEHDVAFHGSTVAGEFRELCGREVGLRSRAASGADLSACLPAVFRRAGYHSTALHGFTSRMFERDRWYPRFGFDEQLFEEQLRGVGLEQCGFAFRGICDSVIAAYIADRLASSQKSEFVYWLTLNAHLPVDHSVAERSRFDCSSYAPARDNPDVCDWMRITILTHEAIARLASDPRIPATQFIIVGDHAPPFLAQSKRSLFAQERVPALRLNPRTPTTPLLLSNAASHGRH